MFLIVQDGAIKMSAKLISYVKPLVLKKGKNGIAGVRGGGVIMTFDLGGTVTCSL